VPIDKDVVVALRALANRFAEIAAGMMARGLWQPSAPVIVIFEHSSTVTTPAY
jgi:hypothetical protein